MISDSIFKIFVMVALVAIAAFDVIGWRYDSQQAEQIDILLAQHEDIDIDIHEVAEALDIDHHEEGEDEEGNAY